VEEEGGGGGGRRERRHGRAGEVHGGIGGVEWSLDWVPVADQGEGGKEAWLPFGKISAKMGSKQSSQAGFSYAKACLIWSKEFSFIYVEFLCLKNMYVWFTLKKTCMVLPPRILR
jgi:hypothetical protein